LKAIMIPVITETTGFIMRNMFYSDIRIGSGFVIGLKVI
jgi:hypothetical protein